MIKKLMILLILVIMFSGKSAALEYGADVNRGPCAANFTRTGPGLCTRINATSDLLATSSNDCLSTSVSALLPENSKTVILTVFQDLKSSNAVGLKLQSLFFYHPTDTTCASSIINRFDFSLYEHVAVAEGTFIGTQSFTVTIPVSSNLVVNSKKTESFGTGHLYVLKITGYTD